MALDIEAARTQLAKQLQSASRSSGSAEAQSYLGSPVPVLGIRVPVQRAILASFLKDHRERTVAEVNALASRLWSGDLYEEKALGIMLLDRSARLLDDDSWALAGRWVDEARGWALSDALSSGPIAKMVHAKPGRYREVLRWTRSRNVWRRRAATYAMHDFVFAGELDRPLQLLERLLQDAEFWVQRAAGTWLRECWKQDRRRTEAFLRNHVRGLPRVVISVATERAPKAFREELRRRR